MYLVEIWLDTTYYLLAVGRMEVVQQQTLKELTFFEAWVVWVNIAEVRISLFFNGDQSWRWWIS